MAEETSDIYRMNKLLEIEHADWVRQLEQAVSPPHGFLFFLFVPKLYQDLLTFNYLMVPLFKGFKDSSISIFEASCILHKYERRTGLTVTREELDSGMLREKLDPSDYDTSCLVSSPIILTFQDRL